MNDKPRPLSELIKENRIKESEALRNSPDKDKNYYYEDKQRRIKAGIEEEIIFNEEE
jgi:hypothetical protein